MIDLRMLQYFREVAQHKSFVRAAAHLHITQPPLTRAIQKLEEEVGVALLDRSRRKVEITPGGEVLLHYISQLDALLEEGLRETKAVGEGRAGTLRIGYIGSAMQSILPDILKHVAARLPQVDYQLYEKPSALLQQSLLDGVLDVALVRGPANLSECHYQTLYRENFALAYPKKKKEIEIIKPEYLQNTDFVLFPREAGTKLYDQVITLCQKVGFSPKIRYQANHMRSILKMVEMGFGLSVVPQSAANDLDLNLSYHIFEDNLGQTQIGILWKKSSNQLINNVVEEISLFKQQFPV